MQVARRLGEAIWWRERSMGANPPVRSAPSVLSVLSEPAPRPRRPPRRGADAKGTENSAYEGITNRATNRSAKGAEHTLGGGLHGGVSRRLAVPRG